jgi:hypothetical protein
MDVDMLTAQQIQSKMNAKTFELVKNEKGNNEIWKNDISLVRKKMKMMSLIYWKVGQLVIIVIQLTVRILKKIVMVNEKTRD